MLCHMLILVAEGISAFNAALVTHLGQVDVDFFYLCYCFGGNKSLTFKVNLTFKVKFNLKSQSFHLHHYRKYITDK